MNIYARKRVWKFMLFFAAVIIIAISLWYTNRIVLKIANEERQKVKLWANAIQNKANLINLTNNLFEKLREDERKKVELWARANKKIIDAGYNEDITFYAEIISNNKTIPVILTDENNKISAAINIDFNKDSVKYLTGKLHDEFTVYPPIEFNYFGRAKVFLYYKDSKIFSESKLVLNNLLNSFISEVVINSASVPVILTDSSKSVIIAHCNIATGKIKDLPSIKASIQQMEAQNKPIEINLANQGKRYIYYKDSFLLTQLRFYPYIQFIIIGLFLLIAYILFSTARNAEQNKVWMGMAKETAHQLGTPLSSLMAWLEILKSKDVGQENLIEIAKDIQRLEKITERFSKIGSPPKLIPGNVVRVIYDTVNYIKSRTSKTVIYKINLSADAEIIIPHNPVLLGWVIENLCKNAVDAMDGIGDINVDITRELKQVIIDISDTGKGIPKSQFKAVFHPGFTSKPRGWGLGLSLAKKIIEDYHSGKIFVRNSELNKGTTFRIVLKK